MAKNGSSQKNGRTVSQENLIVNHCGLKTGTYIPGLAVADDRTQYGIRAHFYLTSIIFIVATKPPAWSRQK